jgi:putative ABC transport system ATP-binding protein
MREPIIVMEDVTKRFPGIVALDRVTLTIQPGEWMAIMGASGSGKSTLLNLIGCLDRPTSGRIAVDGVDLDRLAEAQLTQLRREKVGLVFQHFHMVPYLTAVENVMLAQYFPACRTRPRPARPGPSAWERLYHLPAQLGGEQQRVCIARAPSIGPGSSTTSPREA